jgi:hypothetical protein
MGAAAPRALSSDARMTDDTAFFMLKSHRREGLVMTRSVTYLVRSVFKAMGWM